MRGKQQTKKLMIEPKKMNTCESCVGTNGDVNCEVKHINTDTAANHSVTMLYLPKS